MERDIFIFCVVIDRCLTHVTGRVGRERDLPTSSWSFLIHFKVHVCLLFDRHIQWLIPHSEICPCSSLPDQNQRCRRIEIPGPTRSGFSGSSVTFFSCSQVRNNLGRTLDASSIYDLCLYRNLTQLDGCISRNAAYCLNILTPHMSRNNATFNHQLCALSHSCLPYSRGMPCRRL